ncbi:thiol-disulfide oxidoreductase DCC family protein [Anaerobacillus arseniciselenatis]|uniref:thiol-disulfide oxidoreductase DCC family protein n=1 Tax=Anaerobacillus arseniciselenatis TaxID=85682 RepID=UPI000AB9285F|nr:thiol-disulfide oxidoreductase DCC family protein [Anaerobacillus arseniciselenatis]
MNNIVLFDGECNFCDRSVHFIIKRDKKALYKFASIQSSAGQNIIKKYGVPTNVDSLVVVETERFYLKSTAALKICKNLDGVWKLFYSLLIVPRPLRDFIYEFIARNRYKWFGKKDKCMVPSAEIRKRFL